MHSIISEYVMKAHQDDARRAGERGRLLLEARRVRATMRQRARRVIAVRRLARLLASGGRGLKLRDIVDTWGL
jgi:hypothetical protein